MGKIVFNYDKLVGRIIEKFGSRRTFAKAVGISYVSMSRKLNGKIIISPDEMVEWSKPELLDILPIEFHEYFFNQQVHEA